MLSSCLVRLAGSPEACQACTREEVQSKVRDLQRRFIQLAKTREAMPHPSADASLIAAEIGSLLDAFALRAPAKSKGPKAPSSLAKSDSEVEDLRRIAANPGFGLQALSNGIKVIAGLQQLLRARYPGPGSDLSGQAEEELLLCAFRTDAPGCGAVDSPKAFHTPSMPSTPTGAASTGSYVPCSAIHLQGALATSRFQDPRVNQAASSAQSDLLRISASNGRLPMPVRSESVLQMSWRLQRSQARESQSQSFRTASCSRQAPGKASYPEGHRGGQTEQAAAAQVQAALQA